MKNLIKDMSFTRVLVTFDYHFHEWSAYIIKKIFEPKTQFLWICFVGTVGFDKTSPRPRLGQGTLYSVGTDGSINSHLNGLDISNGLAWTDDTKTMYYTDSFPRQVYAFGYDVTIGTLSKISDFFTQKRNLTSLSYAENETNVLVPLAQQLIHWL